MVFIRRRNNRKNFHGESAKTRLLEARYTEEHIPKKIFFPNDQKTFAEQLFLNAEKHITKMEDFATNLWPAYTFL